MSDEEFEKLEESANILERNASLKCNSDVQKAQNFYNGYQQGLRDLLRCVSRTDQDLAKHKLTKYTKNGKQVCKWLKRLN